MAVRERQATFADALWVWWNMRDIDHEEASAVTHWPVLLTMLWGVLFTEVIALHGDGVPIALYGVRPCREDRRVGLIWMLSTHRIADHKRDVFEACEAYVRRCARRYRALGNAVYVKNAMAMRFVQRLGFEIVLKPQTVRGKLFYPIVRMSCAD